MQQITKKALFVLIIAVLATTAGCSSSKKNQCGCPNKSGMVGYK
ncbi:MAG TPA: hypothetical protein PKG89_14110 [Ferruginibacter sp.]|nr:hypothetical protein [Ferruginibacter sp.]HNN72380.1 hypothetical protein [Ferruginibacter sp.]